MGSEKSGDYAAVGRELYTIKGVFMTNPSESCLIFENENYCLKFVDVSDAKDLRQHRRS